jgi:hypothetical protein
MDTTHCTVSLESQRIAVWCLLGAHEEMGKKMIQVITSFNQTYYDLIGRDSVESFIKYWPEELKLTCYLEEFRLPEHERIDQIDFSKLDPDYELFQQEPVLTQSQKKFAKKAYSFMHALEHSPADWIFWMDADVVTVKDLPMEVLENILKSGCLSMYMGVTYTSDKAGNAGNWLVPETGIFAVNTRHRKFKKFRAEYLRRYHERDLRRFYDNDVFGAALGVVKQCRVNDLCHGFSKPYKTPLPHTVMGEYLIHYKAKHSKAEYGQETAEEDQ